MREPGSLTLPGHKIALPQEPPVQPPAVRLCGAGLTHFPFSLRTLSVDLILDPHEVQTTACDFCCPRVSVQYLRDPNKH